MPLVYSDATAKWVPFAVVAAIVVCVWGGLVWQQLNFALANTVALWAAGILLVGVLLQGWVYWNDQVETLRFDGSTAEVLTMRWVGWGKRLSFTPAEATGWRSIARHSDDTALSSVTFNVRGKPLSLSMLAPQRVELEGLSRLNPEFFERLKADYPGLASTPALS